MKKLWAWLLGVFINLLILLRIVTHQRDAAREKVKQLEDQQAISDTERRLARMRHEIQSQSQQVGDELNKNRDKRPDGNFGDVRLHNRKN